MSISVKDLQAYKREGRRFAMLTAYDYTTARILDEAGVPVLLVGDSLGMTMLGYPDTLSVTDDVIQPTPDVGSDTAKTFVRGLLAIDGRMISLIVVEDNLISRCEMFDEADIDAAGHQGAARQARRCRSETCHGRARRCARETERHRARTRHRPRAGHHHRARTRHRPGVARSYRARA